MGTLAHGMVSFPRIMPIAEVQEEQQANMQEQENMEKEDQWHWCEDGNDPRGDGLASENSEEWTLDKHTAEGVDIVEERTATTSVQNHDNDATTTIHTTIITITPTRKGSTRWPAANTQGLKNESSVSSAVPCQAYESGGLTSGDGKLHSAIQVWETCSLRRTIGGDLWNLMSLPVK